MQRETDWQRHATCAFDLKAIVVAVSLSRLLHRFAKSKLVSRGSNSNIRASNPAEHPGLIHVECVRSVPELA